MIVAFIDFVFVFCFHLHVLAFSWSCMDDMTRCSALGLRFSYQSHEYLLPRGLFGFFFSAYLTENC